MEEAREGKPLLESIRPPRLEDAGLEDCALSPESIKEAFLKAATSLRFAINDRDCVEDPCPSDGDLHDSFVGDETQIPCGSAEAVKHISPEACGCKVVGAGGEEGSSDLVLGVEVPEKEGGRACVDGLPEIERKREEEEEEGGGFERNVEEREEEEEDRPILAEAFI